MMKITLRISGLLFGLVLMSVQLWAQPANDDCLNASNVVFSASESTVVLTAGDSRGATASTIPSIANCSGSFYTDDIWFKFTTPDVFTNQAIAMRVFFGQFPSTDVTAVGMALYEGCADGELPLQCFSSSVPEDDRIALPAVCMLPGHEYVLRIWSTGNTPATEGTFRVGVYGFDYPPDNVLWVERFDSDPFTRGWSTYGVARIQPDSSENAVWDYFPEGTMHEGSFTPATTIPSESFCDGAVGVNSDFNDSWGTGAVGTGPVATSLNATGSSSNPADYVLESPGIYIGGWDVEGISVTFHQGVRHLNSDFLVSYRNRNAGDPNWGPWVDFVINEDLVVNASATFNVVRKFLPGAHNSDSIQLKLTYVAHYYFWMIDDLKIVETECTNTRVMDNFYAIAPWAMMPANQVYDYPVLADIYNAGACVQTNVTLNHKVEDENGTVIYNENNLYGSIEPDSLAENKLFNSLVPVPERNASYVGTYTLYQDLADFDSTDNSISYEFNVGGNEFALEEGATRAITPAASNFDPGAPQSYVYGNYFHPVVDAKVLGIRWGASNADEMAGRLVNVLLLQWTDLNGDEIASRNERRFVGFAEYTFTGNEGPDLIFTTLENLESPNPNDDIIMKGGFGYMALIEYQASSGDDPSFFLQASEARDYSATNLAFDLAFDAGLTDRKFYASVLGLAADGILSDIDYGVATNTFGFDIVPVVRIVVEPLVNTDEQLSSKNLVTAFPNPANDMLHVKLDFEKAYANVHLKLINHLGQSVFTKVITSGLSIHTESIKVSSLVAGNYLLQVETPDGQRTIPVVINR